MAETIKKRLVYIDNLRAVMIILVVAVHTAVTYSGFGMWYYVENRSVDLFSKIFFGIFQSFTQAFFMSFLFMISGYFIPAAFRSKGPLRFLAGRLYRLGIPLAVYVFIVNASVLKIIYPEQSLIDLYYDGIVTLKIFSWSGPLWFALALILFSAIYCAVKIFPFRFLSSLNAEFGFRSVLILVLLISVTAFLIRLVMPIGTSFMNLQFSYFSAYIYMFAAGIYAAEKNIFEQINFQTGRKYLIAAFAAGLPLWAAIMIFGGPLEGDMSFNGGASWQAFAYAFWEALFCVAVSAGLIGIFRAVYNKQNRFQKFLSDNAFGVFVFHPPVLVGISIALKGFVLHPVPKFFLVFLISLVSVFIFSYFIRKIPVVREIFS